MVYEKPFGTSPESFRELDRVVHQVLQEEQIFRIDHFLGKEGTQDLHALRFGNSVFDQLWSAEHVRAVQIDVPETLDIADRAEFYDATGAVLDMIVTHLFQLAAEVAMETPGSLSAADLQAAREDVIAGFRPLDPAEVVLGQFDGYRDTEGVAPDSQTDTFVAARLWIDTPRWHGVPFLLRTGKQLKASAQQISLIFGEPNGPLADQLPADGTVLTRVAVRVGRDRPAGGGEAAGAGAGAHHRDGPAAAGAGAGRRPAAGVRAAHPRRDRRRPVAVHPAGRAGARLGGDRPGAHAPPRGPAVPARLLGSGRRRPARRPRRLAAGPEPGLAQRRRDERGEGPERLAPVADRVLLGR